MTTFAPENPLWYSHGLVTSCFIKTRAMIFVSAISSFPRRRESRSSLLDSRVRGNDVYVVAECMIKAKTSINNFSRRNERNDCLPCH